MDLNRLRDEDNPDDMTPYGSIANPIATDQSGEIPQSSSMPSVKDFISQRTSTPAPMKGSLESDPMMQSFMQDQSQVNDLRRAKIESDRVSNIAQAASQLAQGVNAPREINPVFQNIQKQNQELVGSKSDDLDRKQRVMNAIESRKSREGMASENRLARQSTEKARNEDRKLSRDLSMQSKSENQINKWMTALKDDLDPNKARAGNMAFNQKKVDQAERLEGLMKDKSGNISNLDSRQIEELAIGLNSMLSNSSSSAVSQVEALVPKTIMGNSSKLREWLTNNPTGTNQTEFVRRMAETVEREKDIASNQVKKAQRQRLSAHSKFRDTAPDEYNQIINAYGLNEAPSEDEPKKESHKGSRPPGSLVKYQGKVYKVGDDGDSLEEVVM